jgi:hypothetical protein
VPTEPHDVVVGHAFSAQVLDECEQCRTGLPDGYPIGTKPDLVRLRHGSIVRPAAGGRILPMGACAERQVEQCKIEVRSRVS